MTAWSYSSLTAFETCPRRYFLTKVSKVVREAQTEATIHGNAVHKALEQHIKGEKGLPEKYAGYLPIVEKARLAPGTKLVEWKFALNASFKPTQYFAPDVWCRGVIDFGAINKETAVLLDWKTGKRKVDSDQLKLFAVATFAHYPHLKTAKTGFVWLPDQRMDKEVFTVEDTPDIWKGFLSRTTRIQIAQEKNDFPPRPSGLCANYCPVPRKLCEFSGKQS